MTSGSRKRRTHVRPAENAAVDTNRKEVPKSFVVRGGASISRAGSQLVRDLRKVMEPNTASRLKERRSNKLKDYLTIAGPLGVSHISLVTETECTMNLRLAKFPRGPTLYFRVVEYVLAGDVRSASKHPKPPGVEFSTVPLLVLNNFDAAKRPEHELVVTMLQNYYPTMNASRIKLTDLRRVVLYNFDEQSDTIEFRHYLIQVKERGLNRITKALRSGHLPNGLADCADIGDVVARNAGMASESEADDDSKITLAQRYLGSGNEKSTQRAVVLVEIGPRMKLKLIKATDGLNDGIVLFHSPSEETIADSE